jgi:2'-5' RNA ligase
MKYFVGYLIEGEAAEWHRNLTKEISEKFGLWKIHEKIPPHVTIYRPFEREDVEPIKKLLNSWSVGQDIKGNLNISGFDRFDDRVVFAKVEVDEQTRKIGENLRSKIKEIPGMPLEDFPIWNPHATLMNWIEPEDIEKVWEYVNTLEKPNFIISFNNVTLFRSDGDKKWVVDEVFSLC